jgi:bacteriocin-like protein
MKLESLKKFEQLNEKELTTVNGGIAAAYECSKKHDVDSEHHDSSEASFE